MNKLYVWTSLWDHEFIIDLSTEVCYTKGILDPNEPICITSRTPNIVNTQVPTDEGHRTVFDKILKDFREVGVTTPTNNKKLINELFDFCLRYISTDRALLVVTWCLFLVCDEFTPRDNGVTDDDVITSQHLVLNALKNRLTDEDINTYAKNIAECLK